MQAARSDDTHTVVMGRFDFDAGRLLEPGGAGAAPGAERQGITRLSARFAGHGLTPQGFVAPVSMEVALEMRCLGPWCGSLSPDQMVVAFLRHTPQGRILEIGPCGGMVWPDPDAGIRRRLTECLNGADCGQAG